MLNFDIKPMQVTRIDESGNISYISDIEDNDGYTSIADMPKNDIQLGGYFGMNIPKGGSRDVVNFGYVQEVKQDFESMTIGLIPNRR